MPSSTLDDLLEAYTHVAIKNRAILEEFFIIARQFHEQGVPFIVLKGADVISRLYGVRGTRPISDVDLLVHESDVVVLDRLLRNLGFTQQIDGNPSYASPDRSLSLDIVTTLWYLNEQDLADLWKRATMRGFGATTISCLDTNDLLIYLTAYTVVHRGHLSMAYVQDMKLLIEKEQPDWPVVVARSKQVGLQVPIVHGLTHVRNTLPSRPVPDSVLATLAPAGKRAHTLAWLFTRLVTTNPIPEIGHLLLFLTQPDGNKMTWLKQRLFPSRTFLSYRYGSSEQTLPWKTRLSRLCHLTHATLRLSLRVFHRLTTAPAEPSL